MKLIIDQKDLTNKKNYFYLLVIITVAFLAYYKMFNSFFIDDDFSAILLTKYFPIGNFLNPFNADGGSFYRPVSLVTAKILSFLFNEQPLGYKLFVFLLHIINSVLLFYLIKNVFCSEKISFLATLIWASCRLHNYSMYVFSNLGESLVLTFILLTLTFLYKSLNQNKSKYLYFALFCYVLALLTKENSLALIIFFVFCFVVFNKPIMERVSNSFESIKIKFFTFFVLMFTTIYVIITISSRKYYVFEVSKVSYEIDYKLIPRILEYIFSITTFNLKQELPIYLYFVIVCIVAYLFFQKSSLIKIGILWAIAFSLPYTGFSVNFNRAMYIPSIGIYLIFAYLLVNLSKKLKQTKFSNFIIGTGVTLIILMNILWSGQDIIKYNYRTDNLRIIAQESRKLSIPEGSLILMFNSPDEFWVIEGAFRLYRKDPNLKVIAIKNDQDLSMILTQIGDNEWTRNKVKLLTDKSYNNIVILDFENKNLIEKSTVSLDEN